MGQARRRQPNKELRIKEAIERDAKLAEDRKLAKEEFERNRERYRLERLAAMPEEEREAELRREHRKAKRDMEMGMAMSFLLSAGGDGLEAFSRLGPDAFAIKGRHSEKISKHS